MTETFEDLVKDVKIRAKIYKESVKPTLILITGKNCPNCELIKEFLKRSDLMDVVREVPFEDLTADLETDLALDGVYVSTLPVLAWKGISETFSLTMTQDSSQVADWKKYLKREGLLPDELAGGWGRCDSCGDLYKLKDAENPLGMEYDEDLKGLFCSECKKRLWELEGESLGSA